MLEVLIATLNKWQASKNERQKLQHAYLVLAAVTILVAGLIALFNARLGHNVAKLALVVAGTFLVNAFAWNLLQSALLEKLSSKPKRR